MQPGKGLSGALADLSKYRGQPQAQDVWNAKPSMQLAGIYTPTITTSGGLNQSISYNAMALAQGGGH